MSKKKRAKRRRAKSQAAASLTPADGSPGRSAAGTAGRSDGSRLGTTRRSSGSGGSRSEHRTGTRPRRGETAGTTRYSPGGPTHPPVGVSLARGLGAVGRSPALLGSAFAGALLLWMAFQAAGVVLAPAPGFMAQLEALPGLHSFVDIQFVLASGGGLTGSAAGIFAIGLLVLRGILLSFWTAVLLDALGDPTSDDPRARLKASVRRAIRRTPIMVAVETGFLVLSLSSLAVVLSFFGASLGILAVLIALMGGLYFFVFVPIVLMAEDHGLRTSVRLALRAARLPGPRHLLLTLGYLTVSLLTLASIPSSAVTTATPSFAVWLYVLFASFLHLSVLGAYAYRWLVIRDAVLAAAGRPSGEDESMLDVSTGVSDPPGG